MDFFTCLSVIFSQSFSLVGHVVFLYIHPELALRLCRSRGSFTISVFWALCTSATNIVGLNWFARGFNLVNPKQHNLLVTPCILWKLNHNATIILHLFTERNSLASSQKYNKRFDAFNTVRDNTALYCGLSIVKSGFLCSAPYF